MAGKTADGRVMVRIHRESRDRVQELARRVGVSGINVLRALAFASPDEYSRLERRRLEALKRAEGGGDTADADGGDTTATTPQTTGGDSPTGGGDTAAGDDS